VTGTLYGVGVGPGDPELLTLKAARIIARVPAVAYPTNLEGHSQARVIASAHLHSRQLEIPIRLGFGRGTGAEGSAYHHAAGAIAEQLERGLDVAALCEGDPLLFGTFVYLLDRLGERYPCQVIPGISSVAAAAATVRRPLGRRDQTLAIVPALGNTGRLEAALHTHDTVVILKPGRHRAAILALLGKSGRLKNTVYIEHVGRDRQQVVTDLTRLPSTPGPYFALFLVTR
jgi:precorrin-2/cobalt-factor-2 C20-methyltransferase